MKPPRPPRPDKGTPKGEMKCPNCDSEMEEYEGKDGQTIWFCYNCKYEEKR